MDFPGADKYVVRSMLLHGCNLWKRSDSSFDIDITGVLQEMDGSAWSVFMRNTQSGLFGISLFAV